LFKKVRYLTKNCGRLPALIFRRYFACTYYAWPAVYAVVLL